MADDPKLPSDETTKQRAERIERDYYKWSSPGQPWRVRPESAEKVAEEEQGLNEEQKRKLRERKRQQKEDEESRRKSADPFPRWKRRLALALLVAGIAWAAWGAFDQDRHYSPGPVANAHAMWENNCEACHASFTPIRENTFFSTTAGKNKVNAKCQACHQGPDHHKNEINDETVGCATCHTDHHGRDASLVRVADRQCTTCHANLNEHRKPSKPEDPPALPVELASITDFSAKGGHPDFRLPKEDEGKLKFSHRRHMTTGMRTAKDDKYKFTWGQIAEADRKRYNRDGKPEGEDVQLECASCHQFESASLGSDALPQQLSTGAYSLPIVYENHCAACHPLNYDVDTAKQDADGSLAHAAPRDKTVPHRLNAEQLREFIRAAYSEQLLREDPSLLDSRIPAAPLPAAERAKVQKLAERVNEKINRTRTFVTGRCRECHVLDDKPLMVAAPGESPEGKNILEPWFNVEPTRVPQVWMPESRFDHLPHRGLSCRECHADAYPSAVAAERGSLDNKKVMLPQRETCVKCHAPLTEAGTAGARFDCVECHAYHGFDHPLGGAASPAHGAASEHTIKDFIDAAHMTNTPAAK